MALPTSPHSAPRGIADRMLGGVAEVLDSAADVLRLVGMRSRPEPDTPEVDYISRAEGREILERAARRHLDMSADDFIKRWDAGEYDDADDPSVVRVSMLLPLGR